MTAVLLSANAGEGSTAAARLLVGLVDGANVGVGITGGVDSVLQAVTRLPASLQGARSLRPLEVVADTWSRTRAFRALVAAGLSAEELAPVEEGDSTAVAGLDVALIGLGSDGSLGAHLPGTSLRSAPGQVETSRLDANARVALKATGSNEKTVALAGLAAVASAETLILVAFGGGKRDALARALEGPVSTSCPASLIQLHPNMVVFADDAAVGGLHHVRP